MRVSIVIPTFNKVELTLPCLESLSAQTPDDLYEVVIVDNASSDATGHLLDNLSGDVTVIRNATNVGFGPACNQGAAAAHGEFICFLNNDTLLLPNWLQPLVAALDEDSRLACVQPRLVYPDGRLNSAGDLVFADQAWNYGKGHPDPAAPPFSVRRAPDYASGACLLVRKAMFDEVGGFDDVYAPAYYEDTDLSFAFRKAGYRVMYEPASTVVHVEGGTAGTELDSEFKRQQMAKNKAIFWAKWEAELRGRPNAAINIIDAWAHRDQGEFNPLVKP